MIKIWNSSINSFKTYLLFSIDHPNFFFLKIPFKSGLCLKFKVLRYYNDISPMIYTFIIVENFTRFTKI